jgi:ActR/RegA family two-component response regulator
MNEHQEPVVAGSDSHVVRSSGRDGFVTTRRRSAIRFIMLAGLATVATIVAALSLAAFPRPKRASDAATTATISQSEINKKQGENPPVEYWAVPF